MKVILDNGVDIETMIETSVSDIKRMEVTVGKLESVDAKNELDFENVYSKLDTIYKELEELRIAVKGRDESIWNWIKKIFTSKTPSNIEETTVEIDK